MSNTAIVLAVTASLTLNVVERDQQLNVVSVNVANLSVTNSDATVATAVLSVDGSTLQVTALNNPGVTTVTVTDSHANISGSVTVTVTPGAAVSLSLEEPVASAPPETSAPAPETAAPTQPAA